MVPNLDVFEKSIKIITNGSVVESSCDIEGIQTYANLKVIEIVDDNNIYIYMLGIDW